MSTCGLFPFATETRHVEPELFQRVQRIIVADDADHGDAAAAQRGAQRGVVAGAAEAAAIGDRRPHGCEAQGGR